jgi:predicted aspartyl protease
MRPVAQLAVVAAALVLRSVMAVEPQSPFGPPRVTFAEAGESQGWVPLDLHHDRYIYVSGVIGGRTSEMVVDSGAGATVVDVSLARSLGLHLEGGVTAKGVGGSVPAQLARSVPITVGAFSATLPAVAVIDLRGVQDQLGRAMPVILGRDIFSVAVVDIDYPGRRLWFRDPATTRPRGGMVVALRADGGRYQVEGRIDALPSARFDLDTGSSDALVVFRAFALANRLLEGRAPLSTRLVGGVGGSSVARIGTIGTFSIGSLSMRNVPTVFHQGETGAFATTQAAGLVGGGLLTHFRVIFDTPGRTLTLMPPGSGGLSFLKDRLGLQVIYRNGTLRVTHVAAGSAAERDGWRAGDEIRSVDGSPIPPDYWSLWKRAWSRAAGEHLTLRDGKGTDRRITLSDHY